MKIFAIRLDKLYCLAYISCAGITAPTLKPAPQGQIGITMRLKNAKIANKMLLDIFEIGTLDNSTPTVFVNDSGEICVSKKQWDSWIDPRLVELADKHGGYWECQNSAFIVFRL